VYYRAVVEVKKEIPIESTLAAPSRVEVPPAAIDSLTMSALSRAQFGIRFSTDTAVVLIYNMLAVKDFSAAIAKVNRPLLYAYEPFTQSTADLLKAKLGDDARLEKFDDAGHALFVDDADRFNQLLEKFVEGLRLAPRTN
jgi:pimeloyl-ACP methyl ester carboxylesterase